MASALSTAISTGTTVDGVVIIGSTLTAVTPSGSYVVEDKSNYYRDIAIIVGIVIPIGISNIFNNIFSYYFHCRHYFNEKRCNLC